MLVVVCQVCGLPECRRCGECARVHGDQELSAGLCGTCRGRVYSTETIQSTGRVAAEGVQGDTCHLAMWFGLNFQEGPRLPFQG